jgi:hypothetical protein
VTQAVGLTQVPVTYVVGGPMHRATVRSVLFPGQDDETVARQPGWDGAVRGLTELPRRLRPLAGRQLALAVAEVLSFPVGDLLVAGWRTHSALRAAGWATLRHPGARELVTLASHRITTTYHPRINLIVDGVEIETVTFDLAIDATVDSLQAIVRAGRLAEIQSGRTGLKVGLSWRGVELASATAEIDAALTVSLGDGVELVSFAEPRRPHAGGGEGV